MCKHKPKRKSVVYFPYKEILEKAKKYAKKNHKKLVVLGETFPWKAYQHVQYKSPQEWMQPGDVPVTYADTSVLERDFAFKPHTSLRDGLRKFAEWYKDFYM